MEKQFIKVNNLLINRDKIDYFKVTDQNNQLIISINGQVLTERITESIAKQLFSLLEYREIR